jgi:hypothetical protein
MQTPQIKLNSHVMLSLSTHKETSPFFFQLSYLTNSLSFMQLEGCYHVHKSPQLVPTLVKGKIVPVLN